MRDFFAMVDRINEYCKAGDHEKGLSASLELGTFLRLAMLNGKLSPNQANAIINLIGVC